MNDDPTAALNELDEVLRLLPGSAPDTARAQRVRAACHLELVQSGGSPAIAQRGAAGRRLESALVGGFCAVYFSGVALIALRTHGLL